MGNNGHGNGLFGPNTGDQQELKAVLHLFSETIFLTRYDTAGNVSSCYEVSPLDLASAFTGVPVTTGLLPRDTLWLARQGADERIGVFVPPAVREVTFARGAKSQTAAVPMPPLVFTGQGAKYSCYAVKQYPGENEGLFHAPLPNVHDGGAVCPGDVHFPVCSARTIGEAVTLFFQSVFSNHLTNEKSRAHPKNVLALWEQLAKDGAREYPLDDLVPTGRTLSYLVTGRSGGNGDV